MKTLKLLTAVFITLLLSSCSGNDGEDDTTPPSSSTENTWTIGGHTYRQNGPVTQGTDYYPYPYDDKLFTIVHATNVTPSSNGLFSGVDFQFNTNEPGIYTIKSQETLISDLTAKYMCIKVTNANEQNQGALYGSVDGNGTATVEKVDGKFVITAINSVAMTKLLDTGLNAPASETFTCYKVK